MRSVSAASCCSNVNVVIFFPMLQNLQYMKTNWRHIHKHILALGLTAEVHWWGLISPTGWHSQAYRAWPNQKTSTIAGATVRGKSHPLISPLLRKYASFQTQCPLTSGGALLYEIHVMRHCRKTRARPFLWGSLGGVTRLQKYSSSVYFHWKKFVIIGAGGLIPTQ